MLRLPHRYCSSITSLLASTSTSNSFAPEIKKSSDEKRFKYDVFLSFRGEDTRKNFVDHLYEALKDKGIYTYKDDEKIKKGKRISDDLFKSIQDSKFYIIVFSKNYASSSWCLEELVKIMECQKMTGHTAYPLFYDVEPTEVRKQSGAVGETFAKHEKEEAAGKWKEALKEAADLAGWELKNILDGHEAKFIKKVVQEISLELRPINSGFDEKLVGMDTRVNDVVSSLEVCIDEVRMIGIKGMGGAGKTTTARAVFDHLSADFEAKSFVENVREVSNGSMSGLKKLQEQVLSDMLNAQVSVNGVSDGIKMMRKRMCGKKVLLVLDDVDHIQQLKALAGEPKWFKPGSRILITTRDEQVLVAHRVNVIRDIVLLSKQEAISLFSRYAFGRENPLQGYEELSGKVVRYAAGLPLTLEVLGSFLCGKDKLEWVDAIHRLEKVPLKDTLEKLELSYISLEDEYKEIFLDIVYMWKGWTKEDAIRRLECCGFHARNGLKVLEQRSLITISKDEVLGMHDHIEEMGKNIVSREHPDEPNKHSHLWIDEEIEDLLANDLKIVEEISLESRFINSSIDGNLIGMETRINEVISSLEPGVGDVRMLGIWGMGGAGKTTLAMAVFDQISFQFEGKSFVENVREESKPSLSNLKSLQKQVLSDILDDQDVTMMCGRKVLVVLDDVDDKDQLEALAGARNWFKPGSRIIITTRDKQVLTAHRVKLIQDVTLLSEAEAGCLFSRYVFGRENPIQGYEDLSRKVLQYAGGLPLTIKVMEEMGKNIVSREHPDEPNKHSHLWIDEEIEDLLANDLGTEATRCLKLNKSGGNERIAMKGLGKMKKLRYLEVNFTDYHDFADSSQLDDSTQYFPNSLKYLKCSGYPFLYFPKTFQANNLVGLEMHSRRTKVQLWEEGEQKVLKNLKFFSLSESKLTTFDFRITPNLETLSLENAYNLVELCMPISCQNLNYLFISSSKIRTFDLGLTPNLKTLCLNGCARFVELYVSVACPNLKVLDIRRSRLRSLDLELIPNLESLELRDCHEFVEINAPFGCLKKVVYLNLSGCLRFTDFVFHGRLESKVSRSAATLDLVGESLDLCPLHPNSNLPKLRFRCSYEEYLPSSVGNIEKLISFGLYSIRMLKRLKWLDVIDCCRLGKLPEDIGQLKSLENLDLTTTTIKHLPDSNYMLKDLKYLILDRCALLEKLPEDLGL
nr:Toll/interleukin-1 receptor (TIR) domain-containing protein [Tanacetum cinerariifolium]